MQSDWTYDQFDLDIIAAAANSEIEYSYDEDWTFTGFDPIGYTSFDRYERERDMYSFEARLISNTSSRMFNDTTDWLLGIYYLSNEESLAREYTFQASDFFSQYDYTTTAVFMQFDTELNTNWSFSLGIRAERRETQYDDSNSVSFTPNENLWGGRIALRYLLTEQAMLYASIARGYKAGGFNIDGTLDEDLREFDSEYLWEAETGIKATFSDSVQLRLALFYDKRHDQQVKSSVVRPRADGSTAFIDFLGNAAEGTNTGLEFETVWQINNAFRLNMSLGILDAEFDDFINTFGEDLSGRDQAQAPTYSYQLGISWQQSNWSAELQLNGKDEYYFSDRHSLQSEKYNLLNANIGYDFDKMRLSLWGRNLNDKDYTVTVSYTHLTLPTIYSV